MLTQVTQTNLFSNFPIFSFWFFGTFDIDLCPYNYVHIQMTWVLFLLVSCHSLCPKSMSAQFAWYGVWFWHGLLAMQSQTHLEIWNPLIGQKVANWNHVSYTLGQETDIINRAYTLNLERAIYNSKINIPASESRWLVNMGLLQSSGPMEWSLE